MSEAESIKLPPPAVSGGMSLAEAIFKRRSIRDFTPAPLSMSQLSQILWSAQGETDTSWKSRAVPSAGATYPLHLYVVVGQSGVEGLGAGVYYYNVGRHALIRHIAGDVRMALAEAALGQTGIADAPVSLVICADYERTTGSYGERGKRYVHMEVGHAGQNIYLMATALELGTFAIGAFHDAEVAEVLKLSERHKPLYIMPVGKAG